MNAKANSMAGTAPLKALKEKMQLLRDEVEEYRERAEICEKKAESERNEREKVFIRIFISVLLIGYLSMHVADLLVRWEHMTVAKWF